VGRQAVEVPPEPAPTRRDVWVAARQCRKKGGKETREKRVKRYNTGGGRRKKKKREMTKGVERVSTCRQCNGIPVGPKTCEIERGGRMTASARIGKLGQKLREAK